MGSSAELKLVNAITVVVVNKKQGFLGRVLSLDSPTVVLYVGASLKLTDTSSVRACGLLCVQSFYEELQVFYGMWFKRKCFTAHACSSVHHSGQCVA